MSLAMIQFSYKPEMTGSLIKNPEDRSKAVGKLIEGLGGKMHHFYHSFGKYDGVIIAEMPDNISLAAASISAFAAGGTTSVLTTILIPVQEAMAAMQKAKDHQLSMPKA